jgi:hypothetical protein
MASAYVRRHIRPLGSSKLTRMTANRMHFGTVNNGFWPVAAIDAEPRIASIQGRLVLGGGSARLNVAVPLGSASTDGARPPRLSGKWPP